MIAFARALEAMDTTPAIAKMAEAVLRCLCRPATAMSLSVPIVLSNWFFIGDESPRLDGFEVLAPFQSAVV